MYVQPGKGLDFCGVKPFARRIIEPHRRTATRSKKRSFGRDSRRLHIHVLACIAHRAGRTKAATCAGTAQTRVSRFDTLFSRTCVQRAVSVPAFAGFARPGLPCRSPCRLNFAGRVFLLHDSGGPGTSASTSIHDGATDRTPVAAILKIELPFAGHPRTKP